jgi:predicted transcriptional regulator
MNIEAIKRLDDQALVKAVERRCRERLHASKVQTASLLGVGKSSWYRYLASDQPVLPPSQRRLMQAVLALSDTQLIQLMHEDQVADLL